MSCYAVHSLFSARLADLAGDMFVVWDMAGNHIPGRTPYLAESFVPTTRKNPGLGGCPLEYMSGLYQVDVVFRPGQGWKLPMETADKLAMWFRPGSALSGESVRVFVRSVESSASVCWDNWAKIPVLVKWHGYAGAGQ